MVFNVPCYKLVARATTHEFTPNLGRIQANETVLRDAIKKSVTAELTSQSRGSINWLSNRHHLLTLVENGYKKAYIYTCTAQQIQEIENYLYNLQGTYLENIIVSIFLCYCITIFTFKIKFSFLYVITIKSTMTILFKHNATINCGFQLKMSLLEESTSSKLLCLQRAYSAVSKKIIQCVVS